MLIRDPYFLLYLLHVAALFVIALWPRLSGSEPVGPPPPEKAETPPKPDAAAPQNPGLERHWSLGPRVREVGRFQELEASWRAEISAKFSQIHQRISLV